MPKKTLKYQRLYNQLAPLIAKSPSLTAQMATINAVLYHKMSNFFWVGFYFLNNNELLVGPYQGPLACQVLHFPKGVCWKSVIDKETIIVENVELFPDHIACDSRSKSEIVLPISNSNNKIIAVLDIDSASISQFDEDDAKGLKKILGLLNSNYKDAILYQ